MPQSILEPPFAVPAYVPAVFLLVTLLTIFLFVRAARFDRTAIVGILVIVVLQVILGLRGYYLTVNTFPPRFPLLLFPSLCMILLAFITPGGKKVIARIDLKKLTEMHVIRIFVEFVLLRLLIYGVLPESMTFEGRNFDIISGISAPVVAFIAFRTLPIKRGLLLVWNLLAMGLLLQVVATAILSTPSIIQQIEFDQPNIAILHFPYVLLPSVVVSIVLFGHLVAIKKLITKDPVQKG